MEGKRKREKKNGKNQKNGNTAFANKKRTKSWKEQSGMERVEDGKKLSCVIELYTNSTC